MENYKMTEENIIKLLIVDDSPFKVSMIKKMLEKEKNIKVIGSAINGKDGILRTEELSPDIILMDVNMPKMNGIEAVKYIMSDMPTPIIMFSSIEKKDGKKALEALNAGAIDFIPIDQNLDDVKSKLISLIRVASKVKVIRQVKILTDMVPDLSELEKKDSIKSGVIVIGASTGGPNVVYQLLSKLPEDYLYPIIIVQHMPRGFTNSYADWLNAASSLTIKEAESGENLKSGVVYVTPSSHNLKIVKDSILLTPLSDDEYYSCIDYTMKSIAKSSFTKKLGIILTGMGEDGAQGIKELKEYGAFTIAQRPESAIIYSMPAAAVNTGCVDKIQNPADIVYSLLSF